MQNENKTGSELNADPSFSHPKKNRGKRSFGSIGDQENYENKNVKRCLLENQEPPPKLSCLDENLDLSMIASTSKQETNELRKLGEVENHRRSGSFNSAYRVNRSRRLFNNNFGNSGNASRRSDSLHFLMGGNIHDPLNLESVKPEDPNFDTKFCEPIELIVPKNLNDPLNLENVPRFEASTSTKKRKKRRKRSLNDMIVSPAICQRRFSGRFHNKKQFSGNKDNNAASKTNSSDQTSSFAPIKNEEVIAEREKKQSLINIKYRYGNYNHYRKKTPTVLGPVSSNFNDPSLQFDTRVRIFCEDWFINKKTLDIGCSSGIFTLSIAQIFPLHQIVGVDIDSHLVGAAKKNLRHCIDRQTKLTSKFPASFGINFGPISVPSIKLPTQDDSTVNNFPYNVLFCKENYVLQNDKQLEILKCELYDTVLAVSIVKWVHLNWGDIGLKRFFKRVFLEMKIGGRFIIEIESLDAYRKLQRKKRMTAEMRDNFEKMCLFPDDFCAFLLSDEIGFKHHETLDTPLARIFGWSGRLHVFYKGEFMLPDNKCYFYNG